MDPSGSLFELERNGCSRSGSPVWRPFGHVDGLVQRSAVSQDLARLALHRRVGGISPAVSELGKPVLEDANGGWPLAKL